MFAAAIVLYFATPVVLDILEDPIRSFVPDGKFYITTTLGGFGLRFSLAIKMAVVMCTPLIIWQILAFFLPALRPNERKWVVPTVLASTVLLDVYKRQALHLPALGLQLHHRHQARRRARR